MNCVPLILLGIAALVALTGFFVAGLSGALGLIDPLSAVLYCTVCLSGVVLAVLKIERSEV